MGVIVVDWPEDPIVVDVTNYSRRHGAYATGDPNHAVLASGQDWYPGLLALDEVFRLIHSARAADAERDAGSFVRRAAQSGM